MLKRSLFFLTFFIPFSTFGQIIDAVSWSYSVEPPEFKVGDEIDLVFKARIIDDWYLYSSDFDPSVGPTVTSFNFDSNSSYTLIDEIVPIDPKEKFDEIFEGDITYFKKKGEFRQKIKVLNAMLRVEGTVDYQACSDIDGKCIPYEKDFNFSGNAQLATLTIKEEPIQSPVQNLGIGTQSPRSGILEPAKWSVSLNNDNPAVGDEVEIIYKAEIQEDWYLYSSDFNEDAGPVPTAVIFEENGTFEALEEIQAINSKAKFDEIFQAEVKVFIGTGEFRQKVKILQSPFKIKGTVEYQVCSNVDKKCIPGEEDFTFGNASIASSSDVVDSERKPAKKKGMLRQRESTDAYSLLSFMLVAFLGGLAALFTPCVFPMIPMTVTFFTGKSKNRQQGIRNALFYGFCIVLIYTLTGALLAPFMGPEMANELATNWVPNVIFFLVFVIFAISFFGAFDITLPSSFVNKMDQKADKGGLTGIFFMAFTLVLVSFSCTGPIAGSLLVESAGGQVLKPILGMFAFGMAFAIPFTLFAIFPEWLNSLPKSGGWLNSVKVVLGFLELALALKFLSIPDQAYHWGILDRDIYIAFWIVIFTLMGLYLLGKIRLPHDSKMEHISVGRLILSIITFTFVAYMIPGMWGAPLKGLSGYLPPMSTHDFNLNAVITKSNEGFAGVGSGESTLCEKPKYASFLHFPHGIEGYFDYDQALACAKEQGKPVFIDFTGHGCVNCREMEARVWSEPEVLKRLKNDFVMLALYVDDKKELPESEWYTSTYDGKVKKAIGKQNADFQITRFENNAQPYYVILDPNGEMLMEEPLGYDLDIQNFIAYLDEGLSKYDKAKK